MTAASGNELLELFTRYNQDLWPAHLVAYGLGVAAVPLLFTRRRSTSDRLIAGILTGWWLWLGVVFQAAYATDVDLVLGSVYALMFVVEACLLLWHGVVRGRLAFRARAGVAGTAGWVALLYAAVVYPFLGAALGHGWPEAPLLGMAPCPTTIATFGFLLLAAPPIPRRLLVVPFVWALLAPLAAIGRGVYEDAGLAAAGVVALALILVRDRPPRGPRDTQPATGRRPDLAPPRTSHQNGGPAHAQHTPS